RIRVGVRIRPAFGHEIKSAAGRSGGYRPAVFLAGEISDARRERGFVFDHAFTPQCGQQEVYESIAAPVVDGAIEGLHGLIMAYGQTASGKSYTMGALQESRTAEAVD
ncbi:unnamed protein product, partial [Sphacelaria rigidula]